MHLLTADLMDVVDWSRAQFALTAMYHWLFVPLTLGLGFICAIMETMYVRTGDEFWKRTVKFWMKLFGINFAIGVATGIILEFEFGTNWSNYSHFVGDIFGAPLAIEGIMAFFMESTFIAIMFFGWEKVSKRFHLAATWLTAIGANLSALWILVANAWMQYPVGMQFNPDTARNEMVDFWVVLFSPVAINKFLHTITSAYILAAVFVVGVSAWFLLRRREEIMAKKSIIIASVFGLLSSVMILWTGDGSAYQVAQVQPMKLAAIEGLYDGKHGAGLTIIGVLDDDYDFDDDDNMDEDPYLMNIQIPRLLSLLAFRDGEAFVPGIRDLVYGNPDKGIMSAAEKMERGRVAIMEFKRYKEAKNAGDKALSAEIARKFDPATVEGKDFLANYFAYFGYGYLDEPEDIVPPMIPVTFYAFRVMVGAGCWFIVLFILALVYVYRDTISRRRWFLWLALWSIPVAYLASQAGWVVAELGRQPWTIQNLLPSVASVSRIDSASVQVTFWLFAVLFTALLVAEISIMVRQIKNGPKEK